MHLQSKKAKKRALKDVGGSVSNKNNYRRWKDGLNNKYTNIFVF